MTKRDDAARAYRASKGESRFAVCVGRKRPTCEQGDACDAAENPEHHITVTVEDWVLEAVRTAVHKVETSASREADELRDAYRALKEVR